MCEDDHHEEEQQEHQQEDVPAQFKDTNLIVELKCMRGFERDIAMMLPRFQVFQTRRCDAALVLDADVAYCGKWLSIFTKWVLKKGAHAEISSFPLDILATDSVSISIARRGWQCDSFCIPLVICALGTQVLKQAIRIHDPFQSNESIYESETSFVIVACDSYSPYANRKIHAVTKRSRKSQAKWRNWLCIGA